MIFFNPLFHLLVVKSWINKCITTSSKTLLVHSFIYRTSTTTFHLQLSLLQIEVSVVATSQDHKSRCSSGFWSHFPKTGIMGYQNLNNFVVTFERKSILQIIVQIFKKKKKSASRHLYKIVIQGCIMFHMLLGDSCVHCLFSLHPIIVLK